MPCYEGTDPNQNPGGVVDPTLPSVLYVFDTQTIDVGGSKVCRFTIAVGSLNFAAAITVHYATANDTAIAGTHYTATSGTATLPAGTASVDIDVPILTPNITGHKQFFMNLTLPTNATIADAQAIGGIDYQATDPGTGTSVIMVPAGKAVIYDQFHYCCTQNGCTAWGLAGAFSAIWYKKHGTKRRFDAQKAFIDSGATPACSPCNGQPGWSDAIVLDWVTSTGFRACIGSGNNAYTCAAPYDGFNKLGRWWMLGGTTRSEVVANIKHNVGSRGAVIITSMWYPSWDNPLTKSVPGGTIKVLKDEGAGGSWPAETTGHEYFVVGWNDNYLGGCFLIQNSGGTRWGNGGRAWLPYSFLNATKKRSADGFPWWRFIGIELP